MTAKLQATYTDFPEGAAPANPTAGHIRVYNKTGAGLKKLTSAGAESDLSGLSSPVGIANGGTGQTTQTAAFDALAPTTTKADTIYHNGTDNIRIPVGDDGEVLFANSFALNGISYRGTILEIVPPQLLGANQTTITISGIPAYHEDLILVVKGRGSSTGTQINMTFNADTGANYTRNQSTWDNAATQADAAVNNQTVINIQNVVSRSTSTANFFGYLEATILGYTEDTISRGGTWNGGFFDSVTGTHRSMGAFNWENLANAITSIELNLNTGDFLAGTIYALYGRGISV